MKKVYFFLLVALGFSFSSCQKNEDYVPEPYACDCGGYAWNGGSYQLLSANYIQLLEDNDLSRRYYITANIASPTDAQPHNVNLEILIEDVTESIFDLDEDVVEFAAIAQEVNFNDELLPLREYVPISGRVRVYPAFFGGPERVEFNMVLRESVDGDIVGPQFGFTGDFTVNVVY